MDLERIIQSCLPRSSLTLSHGKTLSVLVQNLIISPAPLYHIAEWANPFDPSALASEHSRSLFFRLALRMIKQFELETERIHFDTTTVTFHGRYKRSFKEPKITHGINKDHRPDLRQLVFGLNVTSDGAVPLSHQIYSGNRTDDTVHRGNIDNLRQLLGREDFVYVADSKLCTTHNLHHILTIPNKRRKHDPPDVFYTCSEEPSRSKEGYRIVWIKSSQKALLDREIRLQSIEKAEIDLIQLTGKLNKHKLKTDHEIAPVYLKKPKRVAGLINAYFIAIAASSLIERQVRKSMVEEKISELPLFPEGRTTKTPTAMRILEAFSDLCWYEFEGKKEQVVFPIKLSALQKQLLRLLGLPEKFYN